MRRQIVISKYTHISSILHTTSNVCLICTGKILFVVRSYTLTLVRNSFTRRGYWCVNDATLVFRKYFLRSIKRINVRIFFLCFGYVESNILYSRTHWPLIGMGNIADDVRTIVARLVLLYCYMTMYYLFGRIFFFFVFLYFSFFTRVRSGWSIRLNQDGCPLTYKGEWRTGSGPRTGQKT